MDVLDEKLEKLDDQKLIPGMPIEAFIRTKDRTALNYFMKPLTDQFRRTFKEE